MKNVIKISILSAAFFCASNAMAQDKSSAEKVNTFETKHIQNKDNRQTAVTTDTRKKDVKKNKQQNTKQRPSAPARKNHIESKDMKM
jgi:Tfp pilus assembly major pilin PilA